MNNKTIIVSFLFSKTKSDVNLISFLIFNLKTKKNISLLHTVGGKICKFDSTKKTNAPKFEVKGNVTAAV